LLAGALREGPVTRIACFCLSIFEKHVR
jgi:hypothetical protein